MKYLKWIIISILALNIIWYVIDFLWYSNDYYVNKKIGQINGETIVLYEPKVEPDASYMLLEDKVSEKTKITALAFKSLLINKVDDLKHGQKVRVWYGGNVNNEKIAEKIVLYSLFDFK